jgi:hypothetical protein
LRAVIFQGGLHQCPSEKGAKASRLLASTSRSLVTSRLTLPANAGRLRLLPPKTPVRETRRRRKTDSNPPHHRQEPYSAEEAIAGMDAASVDRALIHPVMFLANDEGQAADDLDLERSNSAGLPERCFLGTDS